MKHAVLCRVLTHLHGKPGAFRVIDTHAGAGVYDLGGAEAGKTLEWQDGIGRLMQAELEKPVRALLAPYLDAVAAVNSPGALEGLSRLAGDRAVAAAPAGPAGRLRAGAGGRRSAVAHLARRHPRQGGRDRRLDRAERLRAAQGTPRPGSDRSAVRARRRIFSARPGPCRRAPQMADRALHALVSRSRKQSEVTAFVRKLGRSGIAKNVAGGTDRCNRHCQQRFARQRAHRGQSALDFARRDQCHASGLGAHSLPRCNVQNDKPNGSRVNCRAEALRLFSHDLK